MIPNVNSRTARTKSPQTANSERKRGLKDRQALGEHIPYFVALLRSGLPESGLDSIGGSARTGRPIGDEPFVSDLEDLLKTAFTPRPRGRPRTRDIPLSH